MKLCYLLCIIGVVSASPTQPLRRADSAEEEPKPGESALDFLDRLINATLAEEAHNKAATARKRGFDAYDDPIESGPSFYPHQKRDDDTEIITEWTHGIFEQNFTVGDNKDKVSIMVDLNPNKCAHGFKLDDEIGPWINSANTGEEPHTTTLRGIIMDTHSQFHTRGDNEDPFAAYTIKNFELLQTNIDTLYDELTKCPYDATRISGEGVSNTMKKLLCVGCEASTVMMYVAAGASGAVGLGLAAIFMDLIFDVDHALNVKNDVQTALAGAIGGMAGYFVVKLKEHGTIDRAAVVVTNPVDSSRELGTAVVGAAAAAVAVARQPQDMQARLRARVAIAQNTLAAFGNKIVQGMINAIRLSGGAPPTAEETQQCIEMGTIRSDFRTALERAGNAGISGIGSVSQVREVIVGDQQC